MGFAYITCFQFMMFPRFHVSLSPTSAFPSAAPAALHFPLPLCSILPFPPLGFLSLLNPLLHPLLLLSPFSCCPPPHRHPFCLHALLPPYRFPSSASSESRTKDENLRNFVLSHSKSNPPMNRSASARRGSPGPGGKISLTNFSPFEWK